MKPVLLDKILSDESFRQKLFPVTRNKVYLAHAAVGPLPACVSNAVANYVANAGEIGQFGFLHHETEMEARRLAAELIGASAEEIAFVSSTSAGLNTVASGLCWNTGDNVVISEGDFPSNIYPWLNLQKKGVITRFIPRNPNGVIRLADVAKQIDERTRLVSLSTINFCVGTPAAIDEIGKFLHSKGILFCVDAIQSLGALPCRVDNVDFLTADAHKWLLGPQGIGILFVRHEHFSKLHPPQVGWKSVVDNTDYSRVSLKLFDSALRYEPGGLNILGLMGLHAALKLITSIDISVITDQITSLLLKIASGLKENGYEIQGKMFKNLPTGIISFSHKDKDMVRLYQKLNNKGIITSLRKDLQYRTCVRVSPHFYNTEDEIDILLKTLRKI